VGHEINLITTFQHLQDFVYNVGLYYFIPGGVFDSATRNAKIPTGSTPN